MKKINRLQGLYVHIPFCIRKCNYCSFYSISNKVDEKDYLKSLILHIRFLLDEFEFGSNFSTLYFGGGTPSIASLTFYSEFFEEIGRYIALENIEEITIEANPETLTNEYLKGLKSVGINRISIGIQSTDDKILKKLGRVHNVSKAVQSLDYALNVFENVSIDFIIGIKGQENKKIEKIFDLPNIANVNHISVYMLEGEKNHYLKSDDESCVRLYKESIAFLESLGFNQYEISNFAKKGFESLHNSLYWTGCNYLGVGVSAHSFITDFKSGIRFSEQSNYHNFIKNRYKIEKTELNSDELIKEFFMLGLRMKKGVNIKDFKSRWGVNPEHYFKEQLKYFESFFNLSEHSISLTIEGFLVSNEIFEAILF